MTVRFTSLTDGNLLAEAELGNHEAIRGVCRSAAADLEAVPALLDKSPALAAIHAHLLGVARDQCPNTAFGWRRKNAKETWVLVERCRVATIDLRRTGILNCSDCLRAIDEWLSKIVAHEPPDDALGWRQPGKRGRRSEQSNNTLRNWEIRCEVRERIRDGMKWKSACAAVADAVCLTPKSVERICKGIRADSKLSFPEDMFPLDPKWLELRTKAFEAKRIEVPTSGNTIERAEVK